MQKGFLDSRSKLPKTRSGKVVFKSPLPPFDTRHFPALSSKKVFTGSLDSGLPTSPYCNITLPDELLDLLQSRKDAPVFGVVLGTNSPDEVLPAGFGNPVDVPGGSSNCVTVVLGYAGAGLLSNAPLPNPKASWSSLFSNNPRNAGRYISKCYEIGNVNEVLTLPQDVDASIAFWKNTLVGFFRPQSTIHCCKKLPVESLAP